ncbi:unnamed protein product, partial [Dovyalis caffra]
LVDWSHREGDFCGVIKGKEKEKDGSKASCAEESSAFSNSESNSHKNILLADKKVFAFSDPVYSILSKNASSDHLPGSGCSPDTTKSMVDGGMPHFVAETIEHTRSIGGTHEVPYEEETDIQEQQGTPHVERSRAAHQNRPAEQNMRIESEDTMATNP